MVFQCDNLAVLLEVSISKMIILRLTRLKFPTFQLVSRERPKTTMSVLLKTKLPQILLLASKVVKSDEIIVAEI